MRGRSALVGLAVLTACGLSACGGQGSGATSAVRPSTSLVATSPSVAPTSTASPAAASGAPTVQAAASAIPAADQVAATKAVQAFYDGLNTALATGDTSHVMDGASVNCTACKALAANVTQIVSAPSHEGLMTHVDSIQLAPSPDSKGLVALVTTTSAAGSVVDASGVRTQIPAPGTTHQTLHIIKAKTWVITKIEDANAPA